MQTHSHADMPYTRYPWRVPGIETETENWNCFSCHSCVNEMWNLQSAKRPKICLSKCPSVSAKRPRRHSHLASSKSSSVHLQLF